MLSISRLPPLSVEEACRLQFGLVDAITREFEGSHWLTRGELGVGSDNAGPPFTQAAERALARFFGTEDAVFVTGAGTGAIRSALFAMLPPMSRILVHDAPMYSTTKVTFRAAGYQAVPVDMNDEAKLGKALASEDVAAVYLQHTRQQLADRYSMEAVIRMARERRPSTPIVVDDNYSVANTPRIGVQYGADVSAFSIFKLLGPEGIGLVLTTRGIARRIRADMYSGGRRVQGFQAQDSLIGFTHAFVANAVTQDTVEEVAERLRSRTDGTIAEAVVANMQSPVALIRFRDPIGREVVASAAEFGAAPFPVGAMSRYELTPMVYRGSGAMVQSLGEEEARHWIRVNPMRAGVETVVSIIERAVAGISGRVS